MPRIDFKTQRIAAVTPAYCVEAQIQGVLREPPSFFRHVIVVDDASGDHTVELVAAAARVNRRVILSRHDKNQGVGGAMVSAFRKARELGAQLVVKIDGDGQMDMRYLPALLEPLLLGKADY